MAKREDDEYRKEMRELRRDTAWSIWHWLPVLLLAIALLVAIGWGLQATGIIESNIDREVTGSSEVQILECKTAGINGVKLWKDGVPEYVQLQVMHQLAVTGKQAADVAVLLGGQHLEIHRIERDE